jgi:hypothetical protein
MYWPERVTAQDGVASRRMRRDGASAELPQMYADVSACHWVRVRGAGTADGGDGWTVLEEDDEVLRGVKRKVLDAHTEIVHDESCLLRDAARQPRCDQPPCRAVLL